MTVKMTWDEWVKKFVPVHNPIYERDFEGYMFETFGEEIKWLGLYNVAAGGYRGWTLIDNNDGKPSYIIEGWHLVNRLAYFITEKPFNPKKDYMIEV